MRSEPLVQIGVVRVEQLEHAAVLAQHGGEQQLRLAAKCVAQVRVEVRILGREIGELAEIEPLAGEVLDEPLRARVGEHARDLCGEHRRIVELAGGREREQLVVRDAAPEKERQARRELEIADPVDGADRDVGGVALEPIEESRIDEQPRQRVLDADLEIAAFLAPEPIELQQGLHRVVVGRHRAAVRARREPREDALRAGRLRRRGARACR